MLLNKMVKSYQCYRASMHFSCTFKVQLNGKISPNSLADLLELRRLRKARQGIDVSKLNKGDLKKKRKRPKEGDQGGLKQGAPVHEDEE